MAHQSVLLHEVIDGLNLRPNDIVLDGTVGSGGHAEAIVGKLSNQGQFIGLDLDEASLTRSRSRLQDAGVKLDLIQSNFKDMDQVINKLGIQKVNKIVLDLGWSTDQFETSGRGFSFKKDEPLLMTLKSNPGSDDLTALEIINQYSEDELVSIFRNYGEEKYARPIAKKIIDGRKIDLIRTSGELVKIIESAVPNSYRHDRIHSATRVFQAIRIAVNDELESLKQAINTAYQILAPDGRLAIISFHSLEDRIVKNTFNDLQNRELVRIISKKPITASQEEVTDNPKSRSAKLRIIEKINK